MDHVGRGLGVIGDIIARGLGWIMPGDEEEELPPNYNGDRMRRLFRLRRLEEIRLRNDDDDWFILS
jgi:hypothetical protein